MNNIINWKEKKKHHSSDIHVQYTVNLFSKRYNELKLIIIVMCFLLIISYYLQFSSYSSVVSSPHSLLTVTVTVLSDHLMSGTCIYTLRSVVL